MTDRVLTASAGGTFTDLEVLTGGVCTPDTDDELWFFYDRIPEARWFLQFVGRSMQNVHLQAGRKKQGEAEATPVGKNVHTQAEAEGMVTEDGDSTIENDGEMVYDNATDERAAELVSMIDGPFGVGGLIQRASELLGVVGYGYWVGFVEDVPLTIDGELIDPGAQVGEPMVDQPVIVEHGVFSTEEIKRDHQKKVWLQLKPVPGGGSQWEPLHPATYVIPLIDPHPRKSTVPKSAFRAARDTLRRVCQLQAAQTAIADSRLATRGLLLIAQDWDIPVPEWWEEAGHEAEDWNVSTWLHQAILAPIADRGVSSAVAPIVLSVPFEFLEKGIKFLDFFTDFDKHLIVMIAHELKRVAIAWDVPTSLMTTDGVENMNHWNIWAVQESTDTTTWRPLTKLIVSPLTRWYLQKILRDEGYEDWAEMQIIGDTSGIMAKANRTDEAIKLHSLQLLSGKETVIESGFDPEQMPSEEEKLMGLIQTIARGAGDPGLLKVLLRVLGLDPELLEAVGEAVSDQTTDDDQDDEGEDEATEDEGPPDTAPDQVTAAAAPVEDVSGLRESLIMVAMAESAAFEAIRRAGNVLRQNISDKQIRTEMDQLEPWQIPTLLGPDEVERITARLESTKSIEHGVWAPQSFLRLHSRARELWSEGEADVFVSWVRGECERRMFEDLSGGTVLNPREVMRRLPGGALVLAS